MTSFATFAVLYMTAIYLELSEFWTHPLFTAGILGATGVLAVIGATRVRFLTLLAVVTSYFVVMKFPDVANHVNILIYCNILMGAAIVASLVGKGRVRSDEEWFTATRPLLQLSLVLVYFLAGFHKLNTDFLDPSVSCVQVTVGRLARLARTDVIGVPVGAFLLGGGLLVGGALVAKEPRWRGKILRWAVPGAVGLALVLALLVGVARGGDLFPSPKSPWLVVPMIGMILLWEVVGGPLLAAPRAQGAVMAFSWAMHASLALINFVDFGALALALLFTFVPPAYQTMVGERARLPAIGRTVTRPQLYLALCAVVGVINNRWRFAAGLLFNAAALVLIWPILVAFVRRAPRPAWTGVPITTRLTPRWLFLFPVALVLHASTSYLGLRTAGNFSMFSNLRTEGERSNHLLLGGNPLKLWDYQEDVVRVIEISDRQARIGYQYQPLRGNSLPAVEFRKLIYWWTKAGRTVPVTFEHQGVRYATADIVNDPVWRTPERDLEMRLLDFRSIQADGPNRCRW